MDENVTYTGGFLSPFIINITEILNQTSAQIEIVEEDEFLKEYTTEEKKTLRIYACVIYFVGILIIISNLIVVISSGLILKNGQQPKSCYMLLGNVSLADMMIGGSVIFGISLGRDAVSTGMCILQIGLIVSPTLVSIFSVGLIAVDRYIYILHGLYYQRWINTTRVRIGILCTWVLGLSLGFMPVTGWAGDTMQGRKCWYIELAPPGLICIISIVGFVPIILVCVLYSIILYHALRKVKQLQGVQNQSKNHQPDKELRINRGKSDNEIKMSPETSVSHESTVSDLTSSIVSLSVHTITSSIESDLSTVSQEVTVNPNKFMETVNRFRNSVKLDKKKKIIQEPSSWRAIKVVLLTTASFVCTWVPYFMASLLYIMCDKDVDAKKCLRIEVALASPLALLGLLNSLFNPMIYAWWHRGFKTAVKKIFSKMCISKSN